MPSTRSDFPLSCHSEASAAPPKNPGSLVGKSSPIETRNPNWDGVSGQAQAPPQPQLTRNLALRYGYLALKTTLNLDDRLLRNAKKTAAERGVTLTSIIEDGLRSALARPTPRKRFKLRLKTVAGKRLPRVDISDREALYDLMESRR